MTANVTSGRFDYFLGVEARKFLDTWDDALSGNKFVIGGDTVFGTSDNGTRCFWTAGFPNAIGNKLRGRQRSLPGVREFAFHPDGRYYISFKDGKAQWWSRADRDYESDYRDYESDDSDYEGDDSDYESDDTDCDGFDEAVREADSPHVTFGPNGAYVVVDQGEATAWFKVCPRLRTILNQRDDIRLVALHPRNREDFAVVFDNGGFEVSHSRNLFQSMNRVKSSTGEYIRSISLGFADVYLLHICQNDPPPSTEQRQLAQPPPVPPSAAAFQAPATPTGPGVLPCPDTATGGHSPQEAILRVPHRVYSGPADHAGRRHGRGMCSYGVKHPGPWRWYVGNFHEDVATGPRAVLETKSGQMYHGTVDDGQFNGLGTLLSGDGKFCQSGSFASNQAHGFGVRIFSDGRFTIGNFANGKRHGRCETFYADGDSRERFSGSYNNDDFATSTGRTRYRNGDVFTGNCRTEKGSTGSGKPLDTINLADAPEWAYVRKVEELARAKIAAEFGQSVTCRSLTGRCTVAVKKFLRGMRLLKDLGVPIGTPFLGWHGSNAKAISKIGSEGFDPRLRSLQNQGPGEYLAVRHHDAMAFSQGTNTLLIVAALTGPQLLTCDEFCAVVMNPPHGSHHAFCVPLFEVDAPTKPKGQQLAATGLRWQFVWEGDDDDLWIPYSERHNRQLCEANTRCLREDHGASPIVHLHARRLRDEAHDQYSVDIDEHVQINLRTKYKRNVKWRRVPGFPMAETVPLEGVAAHGSLGM